MPQTMAQILPNTVVPGLGGIKIDNRILKLFEKKTKVMTSFIYILVYMETFAVT